MTAFTAAASFEEGQFVDHKFLIGGPKENAMSPWIATFPVPHTVPKGMYDQCVNSPVPCLSDARHPNYLRYRILALRVGAIISFRKNPSWTRPGIR